MNEQNKKYRTDARGCMWPEAAMKEIDVESDDLVLQLIGKARDISEALAVFKASVFNDVNAFVDLAAEQYGVTLGGKKGNLTLLSFDGTLKVQVTIAERMAFDARLEAAKQLIDECITEWAEGSRDEIKVLVQSAFQTDQAGKINTGRVLDLRRCNFKDEKWIKAMAAISDSLHSVGSKEYVRFYERDSSSAQWRPISIDLAAV